MQRICLTRFESLPRSWNRCLCGLLLVIPCVCLFSLPFFFPAHLFLIVLLLPSLFVPRVVSATLSDCFVPVTSLASQFAMFLPACLPALFWIYHGFDFCLPLDYYYS